MEYLFELLPISVSARLPKTVKELRLRLNRAAYCYDGVKWDFVKDTAGDYVVSKADIDYVLGKASGYSVYSVTDSLIKGYLPWKGGIRIGVVGEGVTNGRDVYALKNVTSLAIRIPCEIKGQNAEIIGKIVDGRAFKNVLIISPPSAGKTTFLREIARVAGNNGLNVAVIDERMELSAPFDGVPTLDVGACTDVIAGIGKTEAYEMLVRSMSPDVVITDEIYGKAEIDAVLDAIRAGVKVAASVHAENAAALKNTDYEKLLDAVDIVVTLSRRNRAGEIIEVTEKC